jgi:hypothetical protein
VALLLECGPGGGLVGEDDSAAVHLPGAEQLRPPRPLPAASPRWRRRRWGSGRRRRATSGGARDGAPDGEVAILLRVVVEPRQLCNQIVSRGSEGTRGRGEGSSSFPERRRRRTRKALTFGRHVAGVAVGAEA